MKTKEQKMEELKLMKTKEQKMEELKLMKTKEQKMEEIKRCEIINHNKNNAEHQPLYSYRCPNCGSYDSSFSFNIGDDYTCNNCSNTW